MRVSYDVTVGSPVDVVWQSLTDIDSVLAALPGAALARDADTVSGSLKCKLGASQVTYRLTARAEVGEPGFHTAVVTVSAEQARGAGMLDAVLTVAARSDKPGSRIEVSGDIEATGRGEAADEQAWQRVIKLLVDAVAPPVADPIPADETPPPRPRPPLAVAPPLPEPAGAPRPSPPWPALLGVLLILALLLRRRSRRR